MTAADRRPTATATGRAHRRRLLMVLALTGTVLMVELAGASISGSLALLADAGHMLTDVSGIALALLAISFASRAPTAQRTFGYYRLEILAAVVNAVLLSLVAVFISMEAWQRWRNPQTIDGGLMMVFAAIGLTANVVGALLLRESASANLNVRGAYLEVFGDALGSLAALVAAGVILATGWLEADALASVAVAVMILPRTWSLLREAMDVLLEATPKGIDLGEVREHILGLPGVIGAHDLHAWTITSGMPVLSAHVVLADAALADGGAARVLDALGECLADHFDVEHCTFQLEPTGHAMHESGLHH